MNALVNLAGPAPGNRYHDVRDLLAEEPLDLVIVTTPPVYREDAMLAAAGHVPTVLVEKPLAPDVPSGADSRGMRTSRAFGVVPLELNQALEPHQHQVVFVPALVKLLLLRALDLANRREGTAQ